MITLEDILLLHYQSIADFGGAHGIRDEAMLLSAIQRPYQTFDGKELYPGPIQKAAAIAESLIINHPFVDGNKRIGLLAMLAVLKTSGYSLDVQADELYQFIIDISTGHTRYDEMVLWLKGKIDI